jgi:hypothetical protein
VSIMDLVEAQAARDDIRNKLTALNAEKMEAESELGRINQYIRGTDRIAGKSVRLPSREYAELVSRQRVLKSKVADVIARSSPLKQEMRKWHNLVEEIRAHEMVGKFHTDDPLSATAALPRLIALRDKWQRFGEDPTRVNSMRLLAAAFTKELTEIIDGKPSTSGSVSADFEHRPRLT